MKDGAGNECVLIPKECGEKNSQDVVAGKSEEKGRDSND